MEGYSIEAEITEKKRTRSTYAPESSYSEPFDLITAIDVSVDSAVQNGDVFDITYSVYNRGNKPAAEGTEAKLNLSALYGDIKELYGMDDTLLDTADLSGLEPRETRTITKSYELPLSLFEYCGYDALEATVTDVDGNLMNAIDQLIFGLENPIHLNLNDGNDLTLNQGDEQQLSLTFETDAFLDVTEIVYSVDDTSVASIDENGVITALGKGITTITATLMPSGRTVTITLTVLGENGEKSEPTPEPGQNDKAPDTSDSYPMKYLYTGAAALAVALIALLLRMKKRK